MPRGLQRLQESRQSHFVTFSCSPTSQSSVPQVRGRPLAANLRSLADAFHYLELPFTKTIAH
jgi:hypothetical protein